MFLWVLLKQTVCAHAAIKADECSTKCVDIAQITKNNESQTDFFYVLYTIPYFPFFHTFGSLFTVLIDLQRKIISAPTKLHTQVLKCQPLQ